MSSGNPINFLNEIRSTACFSSSGSDSPCHCWSTSSLTISISSGFSSGRAIVGEKEKADVMLFNPTFDLLRAMDRMAVKNEKYFALALARQTSEKLQNLETFVSNRLVNIIFRSINCATAFRVQRKDKMVT